MTLSQSQYQNERVQNWFDCFDYTLTGVLISFETVAEKDVAHFRAPTIMIACPKWMKLTTEHRTTGLTTLRRTAETLTKYPSSNHLSYFLEQMVKGNNGLFYFFAESIGLVVFFFE